MSMRSTYWCVLTGLAVSLVLLGSPSVQSAAADDHGHPPATTAAGAPADAAAPGHAEPGHAEPGHAEPGSAADGHGQVGHGQAGQDAHHGDIDYNKAPLPGSAPGLGTLFVFSLVLFSAFVLAARTMIWKPLIQGLDQREARVNQAQAAADEAQQRAADLLAQYDARMVAVQAEVQTLVTQARKEAEQEKVRIIAEADAQARALRDQAVADIRKAKDAALQDLERALDSEVARAVEHVVGHAI